MENFKEGQLVSFDYLGNKGTGVIRGKSGSYPAVEIWIVEVVSCDALDRETYPWTCLCVPNPKAI